MPQEQTLHPYIEFLWNIVTIEFMIKFSVIYFFVVWIALIIWVARDISNRTSNHIFQAFCIFLIILFSPLGVFLYLLVRPGKSMYEKYSEEIEGNLELLNEIVQERLEHKTQGDIFCLNCDGVVEHDFIICPHCNISLKHSCHACKREIRQGWKICPYCEAKQEDSKTKIKTD